MTGPIKHPNAKVNFNWCLKKYMNIHKRHLKQAIPQHITHMKKKILLKE